MLSPLSLPPSGSLDLSVPTLLSPAVLYVNNKLARKSLGLWKVSSLDIQENIVSSEALYYRLIG